MMLGSRIGLAVVLLVGIGARWLVAVRARRLVTLGARRRVAVGARRRGRFRPPACPAVAPLAVAPLGVALLGPVAPPAPSPARRLLPAAGVRSPAAPLAAVAR